MIVIVQVADLSHENFKSSRVMRWWLSRLSSRFVAKSSRERKPKWLPGLVPIIPPLDAYDSARRLDSRHLRRLDPRRLWRLGKGSLFVESSLHYTMLREKRIFQGTNERFRKRKLQGTKDPESESFREQKFQGVNWPGSYWRTFAPGCKLARERNARYLRK